LAPWGVVFILKQLQDHICLFFRLNFFPLDR
jgi:hypothetical protein